MSFFDEAYYVQTKLKQLAADKVTDANGEPYNVFTLRAAVANSGLTLEEHYKAYGREEGLNPSAYFNEAEYLQAKLNQLLDTNELDPSGKPYTLETLQAAIESSGLTPAEHYETYGAFETNSKGELTNPSNAFDANAYVQAKLAEMQAAGEGIGGKPAAELSAADVLAALQSAQVSPVSHYIDYGAQEAATHQIPLVQTVPSGQRVANDPVREVLGENVPGNYNPPTAGALSDGAAAKPVTKPADMGGLAPESVSPPVTPPAKPLPTPADDNWVAPPTGLVDTNEKPVIPPSTSGTGNATDNWVVVKPDGGADIVKPDGTPGGTLPPGSLDPENPVVPDKPVTPPTPPSDGGNTGGVPDIAFTVAASGTGNLDVSTATTLNKAYTITVDAAGVATVKGSNTAQLGTGATGLDLADVKTPEGVNNYSLITELNNAPTTFENFVGATAGVKQSGNDLVKMTRSQASSTGNFKVDGSFNAGTGDDAVVLTDGIDATGFTSGYLKGVENLVAQYTAAKDATTSNIILANAGSDQSEELTVALFADTTNGAPSQRGNVKLSGNGTTTGSELTLFNLNIAEVEIGVDTEGSVDTAALELSNSIVGKLVLTTPDSSAAPAKALDLHLSGNNQLTLTTADPKLTTVNIGKMEDGAVGQIAHQYVKGTSKLDFSAQTTAMIIKGDTEFTGTLEITGGSGADTIVGGAGADKIAGGASGADFLVGGYATSGDNDILFAGGAVLGDGVYTEGTKTVSGTNAKFLEVFNNGNSSADWLSTEALAIFNNATILEGRAGNDTLVASTAKDVFLYQTGGDVYGADPELTRGQLGTDTIHNFTVGEDAIFVMDQSSKGVDNVNAKEHKFSAGWTFAADSNNADNVIVSEITINGGNSLSKGTVTLTWGGSAGSVDYTSATIVISKEVFVAEGCAAGDTDALTINLVGIDNANSGTTIEKFFTVTL